MSSERLDVDYLVVGAGASGMAFVDSLIDHADVRVALVDRRHWVGGHWLEAYPFVRLHQASSFYGVASTVLGGARVQARGPEAGLHERADRSRILTYYGDLLTDRMLGSGRVEFLGGCDYRGDRTVVSRVSGQRYEVPERTRIVDARYLAPEIPAESPPRFEVEAGARVVPVNDLPRVEEAPSQYVVVGSGKTATDAIVWLLGQSVDPDAICWVRPRDPWMLNRAVIQPDPETYQGMLADLLEASASSTSLPELFLRLEDAGIMLRIDRSVEPTMAKAPTLGVWELELLRTVQHVVRLGHVTSVAPGRLTLEQGTVDLAADAVVVHCSADGLRNRPLVPIWQPEVITIQPVRAGFPCFGAALTGYVEATRDDDATKNAVCRPAPLGNTRADWARMNLLGLRNSAAFNAEPDLKDFANRVALNASRVPPDHTGSAALDDARARVQQHLAPAVESLERLAAG